MSLTLVIQPPPPLFFFFFEVQLLYHVVLVSAVLAVSQLYVYTYSVFFGFPSHLGHHRSLSRIPCAAQQVSLVSYFISSVTSVWASLVTPW